MIWFDVHGWCSFYSGIDGMDGEGGCLWWRNNDWYVCEVFQARFIKTKKTKIMCVCVSGRKAVRGMGETVFVCMCVRCSPRGI